MSYYQLASWYDELMHHVPYENWIHLTEEIMKEYDVQGKTIVDLGCGTGDLAIHFAKKGYHVTGVDLSEEMLTYGMQKQMEEKVNVHWIQQNIVELEGFSNVDVFLSYLDVVNYIRSQADLKELFFRVYNSLTDKGLFIFDVHDQAFAKNELMNHSFVDHTEDVTYVWECEGNEETGEMTHYLSFFVKDGDGRYERFDEVHHQYVLSLDVYEKLLKESGFSKIVKIKNYSRDGVENSNKSERNFILAQK
ncbi:MAG TPA: class I SAM-dependent methyltransferase [Pseudogracilibacillus sp.]|nr:class I SAM-dependent methyltransferase [Pseudogracilibacillus sp.]